jgi:hypothetical protein
MLQPLGKYEQAREHFEHALALREKVLGPTGTPALAEGGHLPRGRGPLCATARYGAGAREGRRKRWQVSAKSLRAGQRQRITRAPCAAQARDAGESA